MKGLRNLDCDNSLKELVLLSPKRRPRGGIITHSKLLQEEESRRGGR